MIEADQKPMYGLDGKRGGDIMLVVLPTEETGDMMTVVFPTMFLTSNAELYFWLIFIFYYLGGHQAYLKCTKLRLGGCLRTG